jgi:hypothetical protein
MKSYESAPSADQDVGRDAAEQLTGNWYSHLIDLDSPGFLEHHRGRVAPPFVVAAGWAFVSDASAIKCLAHSLKVVLSAVSFHAAHYTPKG